MVYNSHNYNNVNCIYITNFLIMIGSTHAYLSHNWHAITCMFYMYPITIFCYWIPVIGRPWDLHINCTCFYGGVFET